MKRTLKLQFVSLFLSVVIVFCSIPVFAVPQESSDFIPPTQITTNDEEGNEQQSVQPILDDEEMVEEVHLRDAFSKHYRKSNGEYYAVIYPEPVHYFKDDAWEEVDNTLIYQPASQKYSASSYQFSADFASSATSEELITFSDGEYSISWGIRFLEGKSDLGAVASASLQSDSIASAIGGTISAAPAVVSAEASQGALGKAVSQISYQNVFQNAVSLRYSVAYGRVEEDIILSSAQDFTSYQLVFQTNGLTLAKQEDNQIHFLNADQEVVFRLDAPWMKDANASFSDAFEVSVLQKGSLAVVNYVPNAQWLQDEARVFPVLIDPSFTTRQYTSNYEDTYVVEGEGASATRATSQTLVVGNQNGKKHAAYLKVLNLPSCFDWGTVSQFDLEFYVNGTSSPALSVSEVVEDWSVSSITYANQPNTLLVETDLVATDSKYVVDLMEMWTYWGQEDISFDEHMHSDFYGFKIEYTNQTLTNNYASICSSEYSDYTKRPIIKVSYSATPSEVFEDGAVYTFINSALNKYLVVDDSAANYSYVSTAQTVADTRRTFRLIADDDGNGFAICTMHTGNGYTKALNFDSDRIYASGDFRSITVDINTYPSSYYEIEQLWSIEFVTENTVRIVPYQNARYALTASGTSVYIDEYTGAANQLWRVESAGQTLRWDASNIKSTNSLTVAENRISVPYVACPAIDHNSTVAFYSSNTSVATIDQTGAITIKKAGITTITAVLEDDDENLTNYTLKLYVTLPNGTYYFNNVSNSYRIDLNNGSTEENEQLQLWNSGTGDSGHRDQLYKIKHLGNGTYSIRSMIDCNMGWKYVNGMLVNATLGYLDSDISISEKWIINSNENGYYIYNGGTSNRTVTAPVTVENGTKLILQSYSATNTRQNWTIQETAGQHHGVFIDNEFDEVVEGIPRALKFRVYSTYTDVNGQNTCIWSVSNATGSATINSSSGVLTGISDGLVTVNVIYKPNSYQNWSDSCNIVISERYAYELVESFGFSETEADLIISLYDRVDNVFSSETTLQRAWKSSRLLGGIVYGNDASSSGSTFKWRDVAGAVFWLSEQDYFVDTLNFTEEQYIQLKNAIITQHNNLATPDFAHMQISLSARLAYQLNLDGIASNIGTFCSNEDVSYLAGWLGDATLLTNGVTVMGNDDYCADLDAENIYRTIIQNQNSIDAISNYYCAFTSVTNRSHIFLSYISYETVCEKVFYELIDKDLILLMSLAANQGDTVSVNYYFNLLNDEQYHWDTIQEDYPDTYSFLLSLQNRLAYIADF